MDYVLSVSMKLFWNNEINVDIQQIPIQLSFEGRGPYTIYQEE